MKINLDGISKKLVIAPVSSTYPTLGATYEEEYSREIEYARSLVRTGNNYYDSKAEIPPELRMSTAAEELAIQLALEKAAKDPRNAKVFDDLFARGPDKVYVWQWTLTFLRVPSGKKNPGKPDYVDPQGRKYWTREFGDVNRNEVVGPVYVPEGGGRVVPKTNDLLDVWDQITGLPRVTSDDNNDTKYDNHTTHFWFNATPRKDRFSCHYDVAVARRSGWSHAVGGVCLGVDADYGRLRVDPNGGFRLVLDK